MNAERPKKVLSQGLRQVNVSGYFIQPATGLLIRRSSVRVTHGPPLRKIWICVSYPERNATFSFAEFGVYARGLFGTCFRVVRSVARKPIVRKSPRRCPAIAARAVPTPAAEARAGGGTGPAGTHSGPPWRVASGDGEPLAVPGGNQSRPRRRRVHGFVACN